MQDPSQGVQQALLNHVHLLSLFKFPHQPSQLPRDTVLEYLLQAPKIVREVAAVVWQYLTPSACTDGTVLLAWQPTNQLGTSYATDGYVWGGTESQYSVQVRGYVSCRSSLLATGRKYLAEPR